jgi:hypothetical protein
MDCYMLCRGDNTNLWAQRDDNFALLCVQHDHQLRVSRKILGEIQKIYPKMNWRSLVLINCSHCAALTPEYVNTASGLDRHRFDWLSVSDDNLVEGSRQSG